MGLLLLQGRGGKHKGGGRSGYKRVQAKAAAKKGKKKKQKSVLERLTEGTAEDDAVQRRVVYDSDDDEGSRKKQKTYVEDDDESDDVHYEAPAPSAYEQLLQGVMKSKYAHQTLQARKKEEEGIAEEDEDEDSGDDSEGLDDVDGSGVGNSEGDEDLSGDEVDGEVDDEDKLDDGLDAGVEGGDVDAIDENPLDEGSDSESSDEGSEGNNTLQPATEDISSNDPFVRWFNVNRTETELARPVPVKFERAGGDTADGLGRRVLCETGVKLPKPLSSLSSSGFYKARLIREWEAQHGGSDGVTPLQGSVLAVLESYKDFMFARRSLDNADEVMDACLVHCLNHILKSRDLVLKNTSKKKENPDAEFRDQGFTRPRVLIIAPMRNSCLRIVRRMVELMPATEKTQIQNWKRFLADFDDPDNARLKRDVPDEFRELFEGNFDDHFRIGITFTRKSLKMYSKFYKSDVIIASPLGLRTIIGGDDDKGREYDFLSSIEVVLMDQTDVFCMQNWEHVRTVMDAVNLTPKDMHDCDFDRIRHWALNGVARYYRQNIVLTHHPNAEQNGMFHKQCMSANGKVKVLDLYEGSIGNVIPQVKQVFQRFDVPGGPGTKDDVRFEYFVKKVFPQVRSSIHGHNCIYVPSYFDFVRLRKFFKEHDINFVALSEYSSNKQQSRARQLFFSGKVPFMLMTERYHFYKRYKIRGIKTLVLYGLPDHPEFYPDMMNVLEGSDCQAMVLYCKYDQIQLEQVAGTTRAKKMLGGDKAAFLIC